MRILQIGNVASVGYNLTKLLRERGHDAYLFDWSTKEIISTEDVDWILRPKKRLLDPSDFISLKISKYDIVHMHTLLSDYCVLQSIKHIFRAGTPIKIAHAHCSITSGSKEMSPRIKSAIIRFGAKTVFYATPNIGPKIQRFRQRKVFLPNPVNTDVFKPFGVVDYPNRVLCWVKMDYNKGYEKILEAIKLCPDIGFDIPKIGNMNLHDLKFPNNVRLIPAIPHAKVPELINKYPLALEQFFVGAFGISGLEVMSCGKPVISYWKKENDNEYSDPCPVVSAKEPEEISERIYQTLDNFKIIGAKSREWIIKNHSYDAVADKLINEYGRYLDL